MKVFKVFSNYFYSLGIKKGQDCILFFCTWMGCEWGGGSTLPIRFLRAEAPLWLGFSFHLYIQEQCVELENNAYSSNTIRDNFTKFYMQLYWSILHTFWVMTFDLWGQIRSLRPKQKISKSNNKACGITTHIVQKLIKITLPNYICNFIGHFPTHLFLWPLTCKVKFDLWGQNENFKIQ